MSFNMDIPSAPPAGSVPSYPMAAYLNFFPGGVLNTSDDAESHTYNLESYSQSQSNSRPSPPSTPRSRRGQSPDVLVHKAKIADDRLHQFALLSNNGNPETPHHLPSLSVLANAAFGRLTGAPPDVTKAWADAMVLQYLDKDTSPMPRTEDEIHNMKPSPMKLTSESLVAALKRLEMEGTMIAQASDASSALRPRPCGYVFKRGDIAWNCRTCQTDSTCVICDSCFRASDHEGHEVYFHRTTPGGCCDCGDPEAWKVEGCCPTHRPRTNTVVESNTDDPEEAVRMANQGLKDGIEVLKDPATALPPKFAAALGVVIGAAVNCLVQAVDGAGIGADPVQWKLRWADEATKIWNSVLSNDDYHRCESPVTPEAFLRNSLPQQLPQNFRLHLRLHNDDVHTFDEVIDALHEPRSRRNTAAGEDNANPSLVTLREAANEMTHHVDSDGQVNVKTFNSLTTAMQGFRRLKSRGLHCAVTSTPQVDMELRAKSLASWLTEISSAHPAAAVLVVHALVQVTSSHEIGGVSVWSEPRTIPSWVAADEKDTIEACRKRFNAFPPHLQSSFLSSEEAEKLHSMAKKINPAALSEITDLQFYSQVPYYLPSERYRKSPHALWGTLPSRYVDSTPLTEKHPLLRRLSNPEQPHTASLASNELTETVFVVDTDLRKQHEADLITSSVFPHRLPGLHLVSGVGTTRVQALNSQSPLPNPMEFRHLLATSSFRAPMSPIILLLLLDPYPTKQLRGSVHALFLSLLTDARFKCRFAAALGIAYRPLSTLFCAGVGTEADTPLGFTVQIFTAGSLVRALGSAPAIEKLVLSDNAESRNDEASIGVFTMPIGLTVVRCIHTNLLGATKEVHMILKNTGSANDDVSDHEANQNANDSLLPALTYVAGEHPLMTSLPAAPDDGFLDSRSTRHKRLPHLLRDLEYVIETPGTAMRLLLPHRFPAYEGESISSRGEEILTFATVWARLLRLAQGMDPQKRKISGGHVEYEQNRWLEAFGLSLNFAGTRDALAESPTNSSSAALAPVSEDGSHLEFIHGAMGNVIAAVLKEMKHWLYREEMLETGLPMPPGGAHGTSDLSQIEALQRSTLHVSASQLAGSSESQSPSAGSKSTIALSCATTVKMTEAQLDMIESALRVEGAQRQYKAGLTPDASTKQGVSGAVMGDWLRVPHSPLAGDSLSFHLPLHRALAKTVRSFCGVVVPEVIRNNNPKGWWKLPILDEEEVGDVSNSGPKSLQHPLVPIIRPILRSSNCRVVWSAGPECATQEAQQRRSRSRAVSANIAVAKIIHSIADHPIRCLAAAQQIERHLWARNGSSTAGMALNYSNAPLCRSFKDLDLTLVQLSASGMSAGLGARRVFALLISRFSMDGYLGDPERRSTTGSWVNPPRLQDPDHAVVLSESFFATLCVLVTELPTPPPISSSDETWLRQSIRRELIHALAAEPRSHSSAISAASCAVGKRDESDGSAGTSAGGGLFREVFARVLKEVGKQKSRGTRATSGPSLFELDESCCDEYDPAFFHLRRSEHQHAMDVVVNLRKQKLNKEKGKGAKDSYCLPIVCPPPKAHPRFLPCRLMLHLAPMDAAIRRSLLFALFAGSWLPPAEPIPKTESEDGMSSSGESDSNGVLVSRGSNGDVPVLTFSRRGFQPGTSPSRRGSSFSETDTLPPFSAEVLTASSVSFLEVLQLLTLQVHTLEECASLHRVQPDLDDEAKALSSSLSINSYLRRLVGVPESLKEIWALRPAPDGPLKSTGSGANRGSILGLLIALYEHRADRGAEGSSGHGSDQGDDHGGARALAASGLKWLLRFVHALVDGAPSVATAVKSATTGIPIHKTATASPTGGDANKTIWTIDDEVLQSVKGMLSNLADLWPKPVDESPNKSSNADTKSKERGKAAQQRMLAMMKMKQNAFAAAMGPADSTAEKKSGASEQEEELCIICRCDDADGENNGPLGFLGHVQRSRVSQMRGCIEIPRDSESSSIYQKYRVVGHMGCQVRETEAMDSKPVFCLPRGSIVSVKKSAVSENYDILSRRVLVKHTSEETGQVVEGWASVQSSQGYVILSPLLSLCYENTRWGNTRPIIRLCGHAAHLKCVEKHTLSLHQRAAGEQPYDGRFAANIDDGEYLCPLCKQLSNILVPRDGCIRDQSSEEDEGDTEMKIADVVAENRTSRLLIEGTTLRSSNLESVNRHGQKALADFGGHLLQAMSVSWERTTGARKKKHRKWHPAIQQWDYEEDDSEIGDKTSGIKDLLRLLRQQHVAWATIGHSAAAAEASVRGLEEILPFGSFSKTEDPWTSYTKSKNSDPMLLELTRTMTGVSGLLEVLLVEMTKNLNEGKAPDAGYSSIIGRCLADIMEGRGWYTSLQDGSLPNGDKSMVLWSQLAAQMASTPCHVARDGMLSQRHEARSTAAAMWTVRGVGNSTQAVGQPPVPLAVNKIVSTTNNEQPEIESNWGTLSPFSKDEPASSVSLFRPAIASAYLYTPLLAWDLNTLAGAIFSTVLLNRVEDLPSNAEILRIGQMLVIGRLMQALVTPHGFEAPGGMDMDEEDEEGRWGPGEMELEGTALLKLLSHCRNKIKSSTLERVCKLLEDNQSGAATGVFSGLGRAILPFTRSMILMMRAFTLAIEERKNQSQKSAKESSAEAKALDELLDGSETLTTNDGFYILKAMQGPMPSQLVDESSSWWHQINRWVDSAKVYEAHHGSRGSSVLPGLSSSTTSDDLNASKSGRGTGTLTSNPIHRGGSANRHGGISSDEEDIMVDDNPMMNNEGDVMGFVVDQHLGESDEELIEDMDMDEAEEIVDFANQALEQGFGGRGHGGGNDAEDSADDPSSSGSEDGDGNDVALIFAGVSQSPLISYQPSLLGVESIGPGRQGSLFDAKAASAVMADLSHLGIVHKKDGPIFSLIRLPKSFVELYGIVNKVKGRDEATLEDSEEIGNSETAICLLTGAVMRSGSARRPFHRSQRPPGACTIHARKNGSGIGIFFLVQKCTVLLMHNNKSAYSASLYVDEHGEEDPGLRRGRPLFLNDARYRALELLWRQQGIPREVAQIRSTSDRVIRDNW
eukprot:CAMPEP_0113648778 /NCGR_PEP_ID=MMETSP0017_2-20120614/25895_1 /TAXON_ID=2856 /ORGANISM="Cylindrotheca closterium" /LENGTH=3050 /DNA_ID=CAMNT_0000561063 /DNA_START=162 /DNA_END=9311 /DNA_ORIENTATION=- /assembly_acc=CAM_ASM_000147